MRRNKYGLGAGIALAVVALVAAAVVALGRGSVLESLTVLTAGLAAAAAVAGEADRRPWLMPILFWTALSLPLVKHLSAGEGFPAVNADHLVAYPVDAVIVIGLAWVFVQAYRRASAERPAASAFGRALGELFRPDFVSVGIVVLVAATTFSLYHAPKPVITLCALIDVVRFFAVYVMFRQWARAGARGVATGLLVAAAAHGVLCLVEFLAQNNFGLWEKPGWGAFIFAGATPEAARLLIARGGGTFEPNVTAQLLQMALPFTAAFFLAAAAKRRRALYIMLLFFTAAAMFVTFSRGGWLGAAVALAFCAGGAWFHRRRLGASTGPLLMLTALGVILLVPAFVVVLARGTQGDQLSAASRLADWRTALMMIRDHPLLGVGKGNYLELASLYNPWALQYPVHNVYLYVWAETGLVGLAAFLAVLIGSFRAAGRALAARTGLDAAFALAALAAFAGIAVRMMVSMSFVHPFVSLTFLALAGAAARLSLPPASSR